MVLQATKSDDFSFIIHYEVLELHAKESGIFCVASSITCTLRCYESSLCSPIIFVNSDIL